MTNGLRSLKRCTVAAPFLVLPFILAVPPQTQAEAASESSFLSRFQGQWHASGLVRRNARSDGNQVTCTMSGSHGASSVSIGGTCRAYLIFTREIRADLSYDPRTGRYSGTYVGSRIGPASLSGRRFGDTVTLAIRWPKPVNGDTQATMIIRSLGSDAFRFVVTDHVAPGGPVETMTDLTFRRAG